jgi:membrane protease YdiL (CAAX protease family)
MSTVPQPSTSFPGRDRKTAREVLLFYVVSLVLSWPAMLLWDLPDGYQVGDVTAAREAYARVGLLFGFGPMVAALLVALATGGRAGLRDLASRLVPPRISLLWYVVALVVPIIPQWLGVAAWNAISGEPVVYPVFAEWLTRWIQLAVILGLFSIGEELGWRGFMLPRVLAGREWIAASLLVGGAWAVWHYPLWFAANYASTGSMARTSLILLLASVTGIALSVVITWLFRHSKGTVLLTMLFHGSINANMNLIYEGLDSQALARIDLLAMTTAATVAIAAIVVIWSRRRVQLRATDVG